MVKLYKVNRFLKKAEKPIRMLLAALVTAIILAFVVNNVIYGKLIWDTAYRLSNKKDYHAAVHLYNYATKYYKVINFIPSNRQKYIEVQYKKAVCYLGENQPEKADLAIKEGMYLMIDSYGLNSPEYAEYIRRYVVEYYIQKKDFKQAREFLVLSEYFYLKLKTSGNELATINRLYGDLYFAEGNISKAESYYKNAYRLANKYKDIDVDSAITIVERFADVYVRQGEAKKAVVVYAKLIDLMQKQKCSDKVKFAYVNWRIAQVYASAGQYEKAISYYDEAYDVAEGLSDYYALSRETNIIRKEMADVYNKMGRYGAAEKMMQLISKNS